MLVIKIYKITSCELAAISVTLKLLWGVIPTWDLLLFKATGVIDLKGRGREVIRLRYISHCNPMINITVERGGGIKDQKQK